MKIRPEEPGVQAKDLIPNFAIGNCRLGNGRHSLEGPGRGEIFTHAYNLPPDIPVQVLLFCLRIIYNGPPSRPHQVGFDNMQGMRGAYYYPDPPRMPFY